RFGSLCRLRALTMKRLELLLVEDNKAEADLASEALAEIAKHVHTHVLSDGEAALEYLHGGKAQKPDLVLLDNNLPGMSGGEVLAAIRADARTRSLPVIILSSSDSEQDVRRLYDLGANCYVAKPLNHQEFVEIIRTLTSFWFGIARLPPS